MNDKKIDYCEKCLKEIDNFNKGITSYCSDYLGEKNKCLVHNQYLFYASA